MFWTPHIIFELHSLGYDTLPIQNVPFVLIKFNVDVLLKLLQVENSKSHSSEMQGLMLPSHLQCCIDKCKYFFLNNCNNENIWIDDIVLHFNKQTPNLTPPLLFVLTHVTHIY